MKYRTSEGRQFGSHNREAKKHQAPWVTPLVYKPRRRNSTIKHNAELGHHILVADRTYNQAPTRYESLRLSPPLAVGVSCTACINSMREQPLAGVM